jgi:hypothetical protein
MPPPCTPENAESRPMWPKNTRSLSASGSASTLITANGVPSPPDAPSMIPDTAEVTRARPRIATPPTIRRSVSDASATPIAA